MAPPVARLIPIMRGWRIRSLRTRIILSFALVLVAGQGIGYWLVDAASSRNARNQLEQELVAGERVVARLLEHNRNLLAQAARILAADYGFREAIATRDGATMNSVLHNHGERIDASTMQLLSPDGVVQAHVGRSGEAAADGGERLVFRGLLEAARREGTASAIVSQGERAYQLVVVPVRAPLLIAWVAVGFEIDDRLAQDVKRLTDLEVSFLRSSSPGQEDAGGRPAFGMRSVFASTLHGELRQALEPAINRAASLPDGGMMDLAGIHYGSRIAVLTGDQQAPVTAVLQRSLDEKLQAFQPLRNFLLVLALSSVIVSILFSALVARGITRPLSLLHEGALRMRGGDYSAPIQVAQADEIGMLADSFNGMREEIASREQEILRLAYLDGLTGLPNRVRFNGQLEKAIDKARRHGVTVSVMLMGLDRFRLINDTLGHKAGDHVLRQVAMRLRQVAPTAATLARLGGDEFAILMPGRDADAGAAADRMAESGAPQSVSDPARFAQMVLEMMKHPVLLDGQPLDVGASIGIARFPEHGGDAGTLIRHADMAMYGAKRGNQGFAFYDPRFDIAQQDQLSLLGELRRAVEANELRVYYQPKIDLAAGCTKGVEALVRWQHPVRGLLAPGLFMPYAEQTGFVRQVTGWMLAHAIAQCGRWCEQGMPLQVSINISTRDLADEALPGLLVRLLAQHGVPPELICLEITESSFMQDPERALKTLREIDALGVEISIDDFGTGFSSLSYLKRLPVDELKIDRAFVMNMLDDADDFTIVRSTVELAHNLGLRVVAEGVETAAAMDALLAVGCDLAQGFHASRPIPVDAFQRWLLQAQWGLAPPLAVAAGPARPGTLAPASS